MSDTNDQVEQRILAFFNHVTDPAEIVERIKDDPSFGEPSEEAYGIRPSLAERIIQQRDSLGRFDRVAQIADIPGIGKDTLHDIYYSFSQPESEPGPEQPEEAPAEEPPSDEKPAPPAPSDAGGKGWRDWLPPAVTTALTAAAFAFLGFLAGGSRSPTQIVDRVFPRDSFPPIVLTLPADSPPIVVNLLSPRDTSNITFWARLDAVLARREEVVRSRDSVIDRELRILIAALGGRPPVSQGGESPGAFFSHDITFTPLEGGGTRAECTMQGVLVRAVAVPEGSDD